MPNKAKADRAKLFAPYAALKGYETYLKQKEKIIVPRKLLMSDACELLDRKLHQIELGKMIQVVYYDGMHYLSVEGLVSKLDLEYEKKIQIVQTQISIRDIVEVRGEGIEEEIL